MYRRPSCRADANNYVTSIGSAVTGQTVTLTLERQGLVDVNTSFTVSGGGGGTTFDATNIASDVLPDADGTRSVGTAGRTWGSGRFVDFFVEDDLRVTGSVNLHDGIPIEFGTNAPDVNLHYAGSPNELRMIFESSASTGFVIRNGSTETYNFPKGGSPTITGDLTIDGINIGTKNLHEYIDDRVNNLVVGGTNLTTTYNDSAGTLTLDASGGGGGADDGRGPRRRCCVRRGWRERHHRAPGRGRPAHLQCGRLPGHLGHGHHRRHQWCPDPLNRADSSRSVTLGNLATLSTQFSAGDNLNGLTYHEGVLYAVARGTRRVFSIDLHTSPIEVTLEGTLPTLLANIGGMASHEGAVYIVRSGTGSQALWSGDPTNPSGFTRVGFLPSGFQNALGLPHMGASSTAWTPTPPTGASMR